MSKSIPQGINDLVTPFYFAFLSRHLPRDRPCTEEDVEGLSQQELDEVIKTMIKFISSID